MYKDHSGLANKTGSDFAQGLQHMKTNSPFEMCSLCGSHTSSRACPVSPVKPLL